MFGYIRPLSSELKVREFEQFKACYCGFCHYLGQEYGPFAKFILNYDFVFMAMLLWRTDVKCKIDRKRCIASPCRKKCVCISGSEFDASAGLSLILTYWKLKDSVHDEGLIKKALARFGMIFLRGAYKKASSRYQSFAQNVKTQIAALNGFEEQRERSIDKTADAFANLLSCIADTVCDRDRSRTLKQLFYHVGRWIYIVDAVDDLQSDVKSGSYNPIAARFNLTGDRLSDDDKKNIDITLSHSENIAISAFGLLKVGPWNEIIKNILYLGMPDVRRSILDGTFRSTRRGLPK